VTRELRLTKYQATGNDFLILDELDGPFGDLDVPGLCDRWVGVGADGLIRVGPGADAAYRFDLTNADGSGTRMSGNGMRCLAAYLRERRGAGDRFEVETSAGVRAVTVGDGDAVVAMGVPNLTRAGIPMRGPAWETFLAQPFDVGGGLIYTASAVGMGNPHLVLFVEDDPEHIHVEHIGPALEHHELFPERTNVEFARVGPDAIDARVWERGVGETLSCGTGACAIAIAANEAGLAPRTVSVGFRGGPLRVERDDDGQVRLGGPVAHVFDATVDLDRLAEVTA
jgi:diaminopimelate epimerase